MVIDVDQTVIRNPSWWKRRTRLERRVIRFSALLAFINIALLISLGMILLRRKVITKWKIHSAPVCSTLGCNFAAAQLLQDIDFTVEPCNNFYQFTCGGFLNRTVIPSDGTVVDCFTVMADAVHEQLRDIIEEPIKNNEIKPFTLAKTLYKACMNTSAIENEGLTTIKTILNDLGDWPVLKRDNWNEAAFDWKTLMFKLRRLGFESNYLLTFEVSCDEKNTSKRMIVLNEAEVGEVFIVDGFQSERVQAYYDYMVDMAVFLGADKELARQDLKKSAVFEVKLANILLTYEEVRNVTGRYNPMTIKELQQKYPDIPWLDYINNMLSISTITINDDERVDVSTINYIKGLSKLLAHTPKRVIANYLMWRVVEYSVPYLNQEMRNRKFEFDEIADGITRIKPRWKECISDISKAMDIALGAMYVRKHSSKDIKNNVLEIVASIKNNFINLLTQVEWMDEETKRNALEKAALVKTHVAYPDELFDDEKLNAYYSKLELKTESYFKSILQLSLFKTNYNFGLLREPFNKSDWVTRASPIDIDAVYKFEENSISFTAGILQGNFFVNDRPYYMNYGAVGALIGHELTHGFDNEGSEYDKDGNLQNWWKEGTKKIFQQKAQCIVEQYNNYVVPEINANVEGVNTQEENIADNGGLRVAYLAYESWIKRNGVELQLPGLNYTPKQMFWISFAHTWCTKYRNEFLEEVIRADRHAPSSYRILGSLRNSEYFSKDFSCDTGSKMNPENKCRVW